MTTDEKRTKSLGQDLLGISLFAVAVFFGVSAVMALLHGGPRDGANPSTSIVGSLVLLVGAVPSLWIAVGLAFLGARQWVVGPSAATLRHVAGVAGTAFGVAVLCGALALPLHGAIGEAIGGSVARVLTTPVAVLIGVILIAAPAWWAWIGPTGWTPLPRSENSGKGGGLHAALSRSSTTEGVSAEEAEALLPRAPVPEEDAEQLARALAEVDEVAEPVQLPPLYPPDVRREGKIPPGARPLDVSGTAPSEPDHEASPGPSPTTPTDPARATAPEPDRRPAAGAGDVPGDRDDAGDDRGATLSAEPVEGSDVRAQSARADLAGGEAGRGDAPVSPTIDLRQRPRAEPLDASPAEPPAAPPPPAEAAAPAPAAPDRAGGPFDEGEPLTEDEPVVADEAAEPRAELATPAEPVAEPLAGEPFVERMRPSWEQPDLFEDEVAPADAGVDPSLVDAAGPEGTPRDDEAPAAAASAAVETEPEQEEDLHAGDGVLEDEPEEDEVLAEADEEEEAEDEEDELHAEADDEDDEEEEDEDDEEEYEEVWAEDEEGDEEDEEELEDEDDDEAWAEGDEEDAEEEEEDEVYAEDEEYDEEEDEDEEEYEDEEEDPEAAASEEEPADEEDAEEEPVEVAAEAEAEAEPEVVLEPRPAPAAEAAEAEADEEPDETLVYRAGCLFLERNRVAVSLLQREFNLDFDGATRVLDRLQELGLIGPYLGGQKRDILMTPEAWREMVEVG